MFRALMFTTPQEHPAPWILSRRPELLFFLFPTVHVAGRSFQPDGLLRLREADRLRFVAVMMNGTTRQLGEVPMPLLRLEDSELAPPNLRRLLGRVREAVAEDRPHPGNGWAA